TNYRCATSHCLQHRKSESFIQRWTGIDTGSRVQSRQVRIINKPGEDHLVRNPELLCQASQLLLTFLQGSRHHKSGSASEAQKSLESLKQAAMIFSRVEYSGVKQILTGNSVRRLYFLYSLLISDRLETPVNAGMDHFNLAFGVEVLADFIMRI